MSEQFPNMDPEVEAQMRREHFEKYEGLVQMLGVQNALAALPKSVTRARVLDSLTGGDEYLNRIPLHVWDRATGYPGDFSFGPRRPWYWPAWAAPLRGKVSSLSPAECVCILKHAARYHLKETTE